MAVPAICDHRHQDAELAATSVEHSHLLPETHAQFGPQLQPPPQAHAELSFEAAVWHPQVQSVPLQDAQLQLLVASVALVMFGSSHVKGLVVLCEGRMLPKRLRILNGKRFLEESSWNLQRLLSERAYCPGVSPNTSRNTRVKCDWSANPASSAIIDSGRFDFAISSRARSMRRRRT